MMQLSQNIILFYYSQNVFGWVECQTIMKTFLSFLFFLSIFNCAGSNFSPNFSNDQFSERIQGRYEGEIKNTAYEIWIEKAEHPDKPRGAPDGVFIMVFEKSRQTEIEMLLRKYQDTDMLAEDMCSYVKENLSWGTYGLWRAKKMGGLAGMSIPTDVRTSQTIPLETLFYIDFPTNDEYAFTSLEINNEGEVQKITFFETGFIKKPWNYFLSSSMTVQKVSKDTPNVLSQFYVNSDQVNNEIAQYQLDQKPYCNK